MLLRTVPILLWMRCFCWSRPPRLLRVIFGCVRYGCRIGFSFALRKGLPLGWSGFVVWEMVEELECDDWDECDDCDRESVVFEC